MTLELLRKLRAKAAEAAAKDRAQPTPPTYRPVVA